MKTVFKTSELPHIWAHQSAPRGKAPSALSFDGPAIYSYNTVIARLISHKGKDAVLINDNSFSNTTSSHQSQVRRAIPETLPRFYVSESMGARLLHDGNRIYTHAIEKAGECAALAMATRAGTLKRSRLDGEQAVWLERAKAASDFFGLRRKVDEKAIARLAAAKVKAEKEVEQARKVREAAQRAEYEKAYAGWLNGGGEYFPRSIFPVSFRVETGEEGPELVSTMGARVPLADAKLAYRFATSKRGQEWRQNGETCKVGNYALNAINEQGVIAGCHRITWAEIERLAPVLSGKEAIV